jgi:hypothetical protein
VDFHVGGAELPGARNVARLYVLPAALHGARVNRDQFRSPGDIVLSPRSRISASSFNGFAVSGRKAIGPRIPGNPSGKSM